jgi:arginyl-tRNA synthetase
LKNYIKNIIERALAKLNIEFDSVLIESTKDEQFGEFTTNVALLLAKIQKDSPRNIAAKIIDNLDFEKEFFKKIEIAGAGFINFFISDEYYKKEFLKILKDKENYGKSYINTGKTANLEWVSANPTGLLHAGHGRQVSLGKSVANLLEWTGYRVTREYYYNDAGNQMKTLAKSIQARYEQIFNPEYTFLEDGYSGEYIKDIAKIIFKEKNDSLRNSDDLEYFKKIGEEYNFKSIRNTLKTLNIKHDIYFNESDLYKSGAIENLLADFKSKGLLINKDGAVWLKMDDKSFDKDKVVQKSTGEYTYRLPDMAYHINKINRGFDLIVDIFGSDHSDTYKEVLYGVKAAGYDTTKIKVIIHQMVTFRLGEESVKMSKRSDNVYYLDDLIEDVGADATQFFFVMRAANTHLDFDIQLATERSDKNPVYYLQYAYARICGILRNADEKFFGNEIEIIRDINTEQITGSDEINLIKILSKFPEEVLSSASTLEPHKIITYLNKAAESFHKFYHNNRVLNTENKALTIKRIAICYAVQSILKNGLGIIGINAPERM